VPKEQPQNERPAVREQPKEVPHPQQSSVKEVPKTQERPATPPAQERGQENRGQEKKDKSPE
jgi:hypothetical protein